jgi:hypothetical protein
MLRAPRVRRYHQTSENTTMFAVRKSAAQPSASSHVVARRRFLVAVLGII